MCLFHTTQSWLKCQERLYSCRSVLEWEVSWANGEMKWVCCSWRAGKPMEEAIRHFVSKLQQKINREIRSTSSSSSLITLFSSSLDIPWLGITCQSVSHVIITWKIVHYARLCLLLNPWWKKYILSWKVCRKII